MFVASRGFYFPQGLQRLDPKEGEYVECLRKLREMFLDIHAKRPRGEERLGLIASAQFVEAEKRMTHEKIIRGPWKEATKECGGGAAMSMVGKGYTVYYHNGDELVAEDITGYPAHRLDYKGCEAFHQAAIKYANMMGGSCSCQNM